ncbi:MAG: ADOP family duplicated permease [Acidobacteria bacterium]|nr:ADOP family duplicated permease [Acidobacteriota bacterium]
MNAWWNSLLSRLRRLGRRAQLDQDLEDELAAHLALKQQALQASGRSIDEAAREARVALGNATAWSEETRETWLFPWLEGLWQDVRFGVRVLAKEKLFTFVVVLTLTLSIGANTAVFSITNGLLLRLLPVKQPEQLAKLVLTNIASTGRYWVNGRETKEVERAFVSYPLYQALSKQETAFSEIFGVAGAGAMAVDANGSPHRPNTARVTGSYFPVLGVQPQLGRLLTAADDVPGGPSGGWPVVISDALWSRAFNRSPAAVGAAIAVEQVPFVVVGIAPRSFVGTTPGTAIDLWITVSSMEALYPKFRWRTNPGIGFLRVQGRLKPGLSPEVATQQMTAMAPGLLASAKEVGLSAEAERQFLAMKMEVRPTPAGDSTPMKQYRPVLLILLAAVAAVLLIAATNLTNLLLARAAARRQEIATRLALGATAGRVRQQLLIESTLLALGGVAGGLVLARWLGVAISSQLDLDIDTRLDLTVLAFVIALLVLVVLIAGWVPAWTASRQHYQAMRSSTGSIGAGRLRAGMIVLQTALTFMLLGGSALMLKSVQRLVHQATGFDAQATVLLTPDLFNAGISRPAHDRAYGSILEQARQLPGVTAAAWTGMAPLGPQAQMITIDVPGHMHVPSKDRMVFLHSVTDGYFETLGIPLLAGREFPAASSGRRWMCVMSEDVARRYYSSPTAAIGQFIGLPNDKEPIEVVGVVAATKYTNVREASPPTVYFPSWMNGLQSPGMTLAVRHAGAREPLVAALQAIFRKEAGRMPYVKVTTVEGNVRESVKIERLLSSLLAGFAGFGLLISATGIAGLLAYAVQQRRREIGIRLALGSAPEAIRWRFQAQALLLATLGLLCGAGLSYTLRRVMDSYLYQVGATDPAIWSTVAVVLLATAFAAASIPAWRASRINPMEALRPE